MGLASVREKCRSRHASQALLFFLCVAVRTPSVRYTWRLASILGLPCVSPPGVYLPDCEASEAPDRTTSLTLQIELEDDLETLPFPVGPPPARWVRQDECPGEQVASRQH
jgi:hypothetical protein